MNKNLLSENHQRIVSARIQVIGRDIEEINKLSQKKSQSFLNPVEDSISVRETEHLQEILKESVSQLVDISRKYELPMYPKNQKVMIIARLSNILDTVADLYSNKLRGYGEFNADLENSYNRDISKLEKTLTQAFHILENINHEN